MTETMRLVTPEAATDLLEPHQFDLATETLDQEGKVLVYAESLTFTGNLQVSALIPTGTERICCVVINGDLKIHGALSNDKNQQGINERGTNLVVLGNLTADSLISTNATIFVERDLNLKGAAYLYYDNGTSALRVNGAFNGQGLIVNDEHRTRIENFNATHDLDLYEADFPEITALLRTDLLLEDEEAVNHDALVRALESGETVFVED